MIRRNTDGELVKLALGRDRMAFGELVTRHRGRALGIAIATGLDASSAEDATQETLLRAFRRLPTLQDPERFGPWFLAIARNAARKYFRPEKTLSLGWGSALQAKDVRVDLEAKELRLQVWAELERLPQGVREVIVLFYIDGESTRSVGVALGISRGAVKQRLRRGREALREPLWLACQDTIREMIPSIRSRRSASGPQALALLGAMPEAWGATAGGGKDGAAVSTTGAIGKLSALTAGVALLVAIAGRLAGHAHPGASRTDRGGEGQAREPGKARRAVAYRWSAVGRRTGPRGVVPGRWRRGSGRRPAACSWCLREASRHESLEETVAASTAWHRDLSACLGRLG